MLAVAVSTLVTAACVSLGVLLSRRAAVGQLVPVRFFATFWFASGAYTFLEAGWTLALLLGHSDLALAEAVLQLKVLSSVLAFGGLVGYLLSIYSGRLRVTLFVAAAYFALYVVLVAYYASRDPVGQRLAPWGAQVVYAHPGGGPVWTGLVIALFVPPLVAAFAYASLLRHLTDRAARYRLVLVTAGLVLFFAPNGIGWAAGDWAWWGITEKLLALASTGIMLLAFRPPSWARARFGARPLLEPSSAPA